VRDLYCNCTNLKECGATFVSTVGFKHYLNQPVSTTQQLAANLINSLPKEERKVLLQGDFFGN
jgi:cell division protein ZapA